MQGKTAAECPENQSAGIMVPASATRTAVTCILAPGCTTREQEKTPYVQMSQHHHEDGNDEQQFSKRTCQAGRRAPKSSIFSAFLHNEAQLHNSSKVSRGMYKKTPESQQRTWKGHPRWGGGMPSLPPLTHNQTPRRRPRKRARLRPLPPFLLPLLQPGRRRS